MCVWHFSRVFVTMCLCVYQFCVYFPLCVSQMKEMFFLKPQSTFHFRLHGIRLLVKDNSDSVR